jgi:hypothetical protein
LLKIQHGPAGFLTRAGSGWCANMAAMNDSHALHRCDARAIRVGQVKFVALPMDEEHEQVATKSAPRLLGSLRAFLIRVIGRL